MLKLDLATLRPWLQEHLEPICDADPAVLSEYIVALLKHDVSIDELKKLCQEQLEDFLGAETAPFITRLFFYLTTPPSLASLRAEPPQGPRGMKRSLEPNASQSSAKRGTAPTNGPLPLAVVGGPSAGLPQPPEQLPPRRLNGPPPRRGDPPNRELCKDYHYRGFCARGAGCPYLHDNGAPPLLPQPPFFAPFAPCPPYPTPHHLMPMPPNAFPPPPHFVAAPAGPPSRRGFGAGPTSDNNDKRSLSTTTLAIENVPREALTSANVRQFFARFGVVTNVAVDPPGLRALVTFTTADEAKSALSSPEAIFGNRFVRVYRARESVAGPPRPNPGSHLPPTFSASPALAHASPPPPSTTTRLRRPEPSTSTMPNAAQEAEQRASQLQENAAAQKALMDELEKLPSGSSSERKTIMTSLRNLGKEASELAKAGSSTARAGPLNPEEQLALLRQEAASLGIDAAPRSFAPRGRGAFRGLRGGFSGGRGRGGHPQSFRLDNRAKKIVVGEVNESTALPVLRGYFERFGEVLLLNPTSSSTEYLVEFSSRQAAEEALSQGSDIPDVGRVSLRWATVEATKAATAATGVEVGEDTTMGDAVAAQPQVDEGGSAPNPSERSARDEEDDTERSWNR